MKKLIGWLIVLVILGMAVIFGSPYWTLYQLKNAYNDKNTQVITEHIAFDRLQNDIKHQLTPVLVTKLKTVTESPILQALSVNVDGEKIVNELVNKSVDNTITANGVTNLMNGQASIATLDNHAKLLGGLVAIAMDKIDVQELITARSQDELTTKVKEQLSRPNPNPVTSENKTRYCGFNCFEVQTQVKGYPLTVNMERQGLVNWKVVGVKLPF